MNGPQALYAANRKRGSFRAGGNTIFLYDMIAADDFEAEYWGGVSPAGFIAQLKAMKGDVAIRINSPGGDVFGAIAICQAMREHDGAITVHVDGYAASAASVIAVAAPKVIMAPGSFMMIHKAWSVAVGNADDFVAQAALLEKVDGEIAAAYAAKSGGPADMFLDCMAKETWFTPAEALAAGLADAVAEDGPKALTRWDMSAFAAAPGLPEPEAEPAASGDDDEVSRRTRLHAARMLEKAA